MTILNNIKNFPKEHVFLFVALCISFVIGVVPFIYTVPIVDTFSDLLDISIFLIPAAAICLIILIAIKFYQEFPLITKITTGILNSLIIITQILCSIFIIGLSVSLDDETYRNSDDPAKYQQILNNIYYQNRVAHFPAEIPQNARDVEFNYRVNTWFGSEAILLKFTIDSDYFDKELEKYQFISVELPDYYEHTYDAMMTDNSRISIEGFIFYVLNDRDNEKLKGHYFPYHYGIGINYDLNQIIYYYTCPD